MLHHVFYTIISNSMLLAESIHLR